MKLCVDCKYCQKNYLGIYMCAKIIDPVTGGLHVSCSIEREDEEDCGPKARFFEPRLGSKAPWWHTVFKR